MKNEASVSFRRCVASPTQIQKWEFLLLRASEYWDFPTGATESGEQLREAAIRELKEGRCLPPIGCPFSELYFETRPHGKGKVARYYIIVCDGHDVVVILANPETDLIEHHEYQWVEFQVAHEILVPRVQEVLEWAQLQIENLKLSFFHLCYFQIPFFTVIPLNPDTYPDYR